MIWRAVGRGAWTWSSPQWMQYTGQTSQDSSGSGWLAVVHPDDRATAQNSWEIAETVGEFHADLRIQSQLGNYKWFQTRGEPLRDDAGRIIEWIGTSTDVHDLRQLQAEQRILVAELQHRTRNLIAVVHSIFVQTLRGCESIDMLRDRYEDRLAALSRVQGLLSTSEHEPIKLARLIGMELDALGDGQLASQVLLSGPDTVVRSSTAQTLALAVHELSTNALKYGALSNRNGMLTVAWEEYDKDGHPWLRLSWRETGSEVPRELLSRPSGYGRVLIERALPQQTGGQTKMHLNASGMDCVITLPLRQFHEEALHGERV
jgi:two-component system CheB/CheR fusion protein